MERIWVVGAPGSRWSGVSYFFEQCKGIKVDTGDQRAENYYESRDAEGTLHKHKGAYFDPGMDYGEDWLNFPRLKREDILAEIDRAWGAPHPKGMTRIIKSHMLCLYVPEIVRMFPDDTVIMVYRENIKCMEWWKAQGGFDITYPNYKPFYRDEENMRYWIHMQNHALVKLTSMKRMRWNTWGQGQLETFSIPRQDPEIMKHYADVYVAGF
jgi:hypothetical protein